MELSQVLPSRTVVTSFTPRKALTTSQPPPGWPYHQGMMTESPFEEGDWVLCLASSSSDSSGPSGTLSCALSNGEVQVYDQQKLHRVTSIPLVHGPGKMTTDLIYGPLPHHHHHQQPTLLSAGQDGQIFVLDTRLDPNTAAVLTCILPSGQTPWSISLGYDGHLLAAGSDKAHINFFDLRKSAATIPGGPVSSPLLGRYKDTHHQAVTQVTFLPSTPWLLSGSEDGLVYLFDTRQATEDAAIRSVMNVGCPVRQVGFGGSAHSLLESNNNNSSSSSSSHQPNPPIIYCLTGSETISLWNVETGTCLHDYGASLRSDLTRATQDQVPIDYLVGAHWDEARHELHLVAGNARGDGALFRLGAESWSSSRGAKSLNHPWRPTHLLKNGHRGIIRGWCPLLSSSPAATMLMTAGEDARLCEWMVRRRDDEVVVGYTANTEPHVTDRMAMEEDDDDLEKKGSASTHWPKRGVSSPSGHVRRQRFKHSHTQHPYAKT